MLKKINLKKINLKKKNKFKNLFKSIMLKIESKKKKLINIIYFLKYYIAFRKRTVKLLNIAKPRARLDKKKKFKKSFFLKKLYNHILRKKNYKKKHIILNFLNLSYTQKKRFDRLNRLYDIKKKYVRYLQNNRNLYKLLNYKIKFNKQFIRRHIRSISNLSIKDRFLLYHNTISNIILKLKFAYSFKTAEFFIKTGFVFINGYQELNKNKFLKKFDFLEIIFSKFILNFKIKLKKKIKKSIRKYKKYNWRMIKNKVEYNERKIRIQKFAKRIYNFKLKIANTYQIDFRTLSCCYIKDFNYKKDHSIFIKKIIPLYLIKLLNWKIIT